MFHSAVTVGISILYIQRLQVRDRPSEFYREDWKITLVLEIFFFEHRSLAFYFLHITVMDGIMRIKQNKKRSILELI